MKMVEASAHELEAYRRDLIPYRSVEAGRMANTAARLMDTFQHGLLALERMRNGGRQVVTVQHVNVSDGGQAVVAGTVGGGYPRGVIANEQ